MRVHPVARQDDLHLNRTERVEDGTRPGITAIDLHLVNHGAQAVRVECVDFRSDALTVTLPIGRTLDPGGELVVVSPATADAVTFQASTQGKSAQFTAGTVFRMTLSLAAPHGRVSFTVPLAWGFWIEGGYGFTLPSPP